MDLSMVLKLHPPSLIKWNLPGAVHSLVCVGKCECVWQAGVRHFPPSTMSVSKGGTSNYIGSHNRWDHNCLWNYMVNVLYIRIKMWRNICRLIFFTLILILCKSAYILQLTRAHLASVKCWLKAWTLTAICVLPLDSVQTNCNWKVNLKVEF